MISINEEALNHLKEITNQEGIDVKTHYLRVGVKGGGCSGLSYVMDFDDEKTDNDEIFETSSDIKVIIDKKFLLYLAGTELQYSGGLNGKGFHWVNPNASRECGCGESFAV
jgi:iron-sulfur cluster assembly protein